MIRLVWLLVGAIVLASPGTIATPFSRGSANPAALVPLATPAAAALDLAAMSLSPDDLAAAGLAGFGESASATLTLDEQARQAAPDLGLDAAAVQTALGEAGLARRYQRELARPADAGTPSPRPQMQMSITSYVSQYASAEGAAAGFALLESEAPTSRIKDIPHTTVIGDRSEITQIRRPSGSGPSYRALDLTFQVGDLVAGVTAASIGGQEPDPAVVEALAERLLAKVEAGQAAPGPGLSNLALRLGGPGVETRADGYGRLAGQTFPNFDETDDELAQRAARYGAASDVYGVAQNVARGGDRSADARYLVLLYRFASESDAEAWLRGGVERALDVPNVVTATPVAGAATIGDASLTLAVTSEPSDTRSVSGYLIDARVGAQVAQVQVIGQPEPPLAAVEELARAQVACLRAGACWERASPPADLVPETAGTPTSPAETPVASTAGPCGSAPPAATPLADLQSTAHSGTPGADAADADRPPNIILILTDDLDSRSVACLPNVQTLLAGEGMTFTNAFVTTPLCCPSRASLLRGQYAHNHGVVNNSGPAGGFPEFYRRGDEASTVATWLHDAGYRTALFGKYLNRYPREASSTHVPPGWDEWSAFAATKGAENAVSYYFDYTLNTNGVLVPYGDQPDDYATDVLKAQAIAFIEQAAAADDPFFVYLAPYAPHGPATAAPRHEDAFADAGAPRVPSFDEEDVDDKPSWVRAHAPLMPEQIGAIDDRYRQRLRSLLAVDEMVAALIETLRATGTLDSTYVVFSSDNGYHLGEHRLPIGKQSAYDESTRVPLIVRGPGVQPGSATSRLALNIDLAPTFAALAGIEPADFVDGRSLVPLLRGEEPAGWRQGFLVERYGDIPPEEWGLATPPPVPATVVPDEEEGETSRISPVEAPPYLAVRTDRYLYVEYADGELELYDLAADPYALRNLAATADPALLEELHGALHAFRTCAAALCRGDEEALFVATPEVQS